MSIRNTLLITGDSFSDAAGEWPTLILAPRIYENNATNGWTIIDNIEPAWTAHIAGRLSTTDFCIIQGGVNDIAADYTLGDIQTALTSMVTEAKTAGLAVIVFNVAPWGNAASHTAGRQTVTENWNTWLAAQDTVQGFTLVDMYAALGDGTTPENMDATYDSGDGLHPNGTGSAVVADLADTAILPLLDIVTVSALSKIWRGSVGPAEAGASGNEVALWRGSVEPSSGGTLRHSSGLLQHNDATLRHRDSTLRHRNSALTHNR